MLIQLQRFLKNESGAAAIEYGLLASGISVTIIPAVKNVGTQLVHIFTVLQNAVYTIICGWAAQTLLRRFLFAASKSVVQACRSSPDILVELHLVAALVVPRTPCAAPPLAGTPGGMT